MKDYGAGWIGFVKMFLLYCLVGFVVCLMSGLFLLLDLVDEAGAVLGRRLDNPVGVVGSYFVHGSWEHLGYNLLFYLLGVFLIFVYSVVPVERVRWVVDWRRWVLLQVVLIVFTGVLDLWFANLVYARGGSAVGMSDFVYAVDVGALASVYYGLFGENRILREKRRRFIMWSLVIVVILSFFLVVANTYSGFLASVNVLAHMKGILAGFIVFFTLFFVKKRSLGAIAFAVNVICIIGLIAVLIQLRF